MMAVLSTHAARPLGEEDVGHAQTAGQALGDAFQVCGPAERSTTEAEAADAATALGCRRIRN
jgi:hypothetical protein